MGWMSRLLGTESREALEMWWEDREWERWKLEHPEAVAEWLLTAAQTTGQDSVLFHPLAAAFEEYRDLAPKDLSHDQAQSWGWVRFREVGARNHWRHQREDMRLEAFGQAEEAITAALARADEAFREKIEQARGPTARKHCSRPPRAPEG